MFLDTIEIYLWVHVLLTALTLRSSLWQYNCPLLSSLKLEGNIPFLQKLKSILSGFANILKVSKYQDECSDLYKMGNKMPFWFELCTQMYIPLHRRKTKLLKPGQNKKGQKTFQLHRFLNTFLQQAAEKKYSKNCAAGSFFGPSYFVMALMTNKWKLPFLLTFRHHQRKFVFCD